MCSDYMQYGSKCIIKNYVNLAIWHFHRHVTDHGLKGCMGSILQNDVLQDDDNNTTTNTTTTTTTTNNNGSYYAFCGTSMRLQI